MGIFDFFKKITKKEIENPEEEEIEINFSEIKNYLEKKEEEIRKKEKKVFDSVKEKIDFFAKRIREKIKIAEEVDVDLKKAEDKFKSISEMGRKKYLDSVENFLEKIENFQKENFKNFVENINILFSSFKKSSHKNYERATVLIGKEISNIKEDMANFSKEFIKIFEENKDIIQQYEVIYFVREKLDKINGNKKEIKKIKEEIILIDKGIKEKEERKEKVSKKIEETKKSEDYVRNKELQEKIHLLEEELNKNIFNLRQNIDFKKLTSFFHVFKDKMEIVKEHKENFKKSFEEDFGEKIIDLLKTSKLNNEIIEEKIREIRDKKKEIEKLRKVVRKDSVENLISELENIKFEKEDLAIQKEQKEKRIEKLEQNKEEFEKEIKDKMKEINVNVTGFIKTK